MDSHASTATYSPEAMDSMSMMGPKPKTAPEHPGLGAIILVAGIVAAVLWDNIDAASYEGAWATHFGVSIGTIGLDLDLRTWIDSGLMTLFFLVVGLEARREIDMGDLRDRRKTLLPVLAGVAGMAIPVGIFVLVAVGSGRGDGWGVAMSTDTALSLGAIALVARTAPRRVRAFLLTVFVVDDLLSLIVIGTVYSPPREVLPILIAVPVFLLIIVSRRLRTRAKRTLFLVLGLVLWGALLASGLDPVVAGLAMGLATSAHPPKRGDLERATGLVRAFREQPTAALARNATVSLTEALSENDRLQHVLTPWATYVIVPLFALANAGVGLGPTSLLRAATSPIATGIVLAYVLGKPLAVAGVTLSVQRITQGRVRPQVGWLSVLGSGTAAGIGFTVSLLVAGLAFKGADLEDAKIGILAAAIFSTILTAVIFQSAQLMSPGHRDTALHGRPNDRTDLLAPVNEETDHIRGALGASVTVVEYADFECPYSGRIEPTARDILRDDSDVRFVWRHLPLSDVHPYAQLAAEATEAAGLQGQFWGMHDLLLGNQEDLSVENVFMYASQLELDMDQFRADLASGECTVKVRSDLESGDESGVVGTPTFFVNGRLYLGPHDEASIRKAIELARRQATPPRPPRNPKPSRPRRRRKTTVAAA